MAAKQKLSETEVKKIRRRLQAGARRSELALAYGVDRKTITRRLQALERAEGAGQRPPADLAPGEAKRAESGGAGGAPSSRFRPGTQEYWLDERDARPPVSPDPRVHLVSESGQIAGSTSASNAERMRAALEPCHGPLRVVPADSEGLKVLTRTDVRERNAEWSARLEEEERATTQAEACEGKHAKRSIVGARRRWRWQRSSFRPV
jgi:hypothetical protein